MAQIHVATEGNRGESHGVWRHNQADFTCNSNNAPKTPTEGTWLSSPQPNSSHNIFQEVVEDSKSVAQNFSGYSSLNQPKQCFFDPSEEGKKTESSNSFRLFGIEVFGHQTNQTKIEKMASQPMSLSVGNTEGGQLSNVSVAESDLKSDTSKVSKEPEQMQVSSKETQSKRSSSTSARSRTKVKRKKRKPFTLLGSNDFQAMSDYAYPFV